MCVCISRLGNVLDEAISDIFHHTPCPCTSQECADNSTGYKIGLALVQKMEVDEVHSLDEDVSGLALQFIVIKSVPLDTLHLCT